VTDKIKSNEVTLAYCPTDQMIADFFTKPLQGQKFRFFRDFILNIEPDTDVVLLNVCYGPIPNAGSSSFHDENHRSVLDGSTGMSDWLLVTRHCKMKHHQKIPKIRLTGMSDWLLVTRYCKMKHHQKIPKIRLKNATAADSADSSYSSASSHGKSNKVENNNPECKLILL
jgi:hypothetical protein